MKHLWLGLLMLATTAVAQQQQKPQLNEDYTFNKTTFAPRPLHYRPDGNSAVVVDGAPVAFAKENETLRFETVAVRDKIEVKIS